MDKTKENFYVLHYNSETTEYLNDIVFKTYDAALLDFIQAKKIIKNDVIELIYSDDDINIGNKVLKRK